MRALPGENLYPLWRGRHRIRGTSWPPGKAVASAECWGFPIGRDSPWWNRGNAPLDNLVGAVRYWEDHTDWMEFLNRVSQSPGQDGGTSLIWNRWERFLPKGSRVLDLGEGWDVSPNGFLNGCTVELVDPDLRSLWRAVNSASGLPGALDVHWTTGECMPDMEPVDVAIATEVLCYVEDPQRVLNALLRHLKPRDLSDERGGPLGLGDVHGCS